MGMLMEKAKEELNILVEDIHLKVQPYDPYCEKRLNNWRDDMLKGGGF